MEIISPNVHIVVESNFAFGCRAPVDNFCMKISQSGVVVVVCFVRHAEKVHDMSQQEMSQLYLLINTSIHQLMLCFTIV